MAHLELIYLWSLKTATEKKNYTNQLNFTYNQIMLNRCGLEMHRFNTLRYKSDISHMCT